MNRISMTISSYLKTEKIYNIFIIPIIVYLLCFFAWPLIIIFFQSLFDPAFTLIHYAKIFRTSIYFNVLLITFKIAALTTIISLILGYPLAYLISVSSKRIAGVLLLCVLFPFFTSILVRTYAWMVILGRNGIMNKVLMDLGIISEPLELMYNLMGVLVGMVQILLPFMILPLFSVMRGIEGDLLKASLSLGASPTRTFLKIFVPLSLPGIQAGCLLVFIMSVGFFVTPALLGGRKTMMISMLIENQVNWVLNWNFASALTVVLTLITIILLVIYFKIVGTKGALAY
jgi:putative spermidine/putrescine transport system permease protein